MKLSLFLAIALALLFGCERQVRNGQIPKQTKLQEDRNPETMQAVEKTELAVTPQANQLKPSKPLNPLQPVIPTTSDVAKTPNVAKSPNPALTMANTPDMIIPAESKAKANDRSIEKPSEMTPDKLLPVEISRPAPTLSPRIVANERGAIAMLKELVAAQRKFKQQVIVDQDRDGIGEYGFIQELAGTSKPRGRENSSLALIKRELGESAQEYGGVAVKDGYCFCCYLPGPQKALAEGIGELPVLKETAKDWKQAYAVDFQENNFIIYAWPAVPGTTGNRTFAVDRAIRVIFCVKREYDLQNPPKPQDAMRVIEELPEHLQEAQNVTGGLAIHHKGYNGLIWEMVK